VKEAEGREQREKRKELNGLIRLAHGWISGKQEKGSSKFEDE